MKWMSFAVVLLVFVLPGCGDNKKKLEEAKNPDVGFEQFKKWHQEMEGAKKKEAVEKEEAAKKVQEAVKKEKKEMAQEIIKEIMAPFNEAQEAAKKAKKEAEEKQAALEKVLNPILESLKKMQERVETLEKAKEKPLEPKKKVENSNDPVERWRSAQHSLVDGAESATGKRQNLLLEIKKLNQDWGRLDWEERRASTSYNFGGGGSLGSYPSHTEVGGSWDEWLRRRAEYDATLKNPKITTRTKEEWDKREKEVYEPERAKHAKMKEKRKERVEKKAALAWQIASKWREFYAMSYHARVDMVANYHQAMRGK